MTVMYTFNDDDELIINYRGTTNKKTVVNMTHHGFFSLAGIANPTPTIEDIECQINADYYIPIDKNSIPTGEILKVEGTPFDFRTMRKIGQDIDADNEQIKNGAGYDHCFVLKKNEPVNSLLLQKSLSQKAKEQWRFGQQNLEFNFTQTIGLMDTRDNWVPHSQDEAQSVLRHNTSQTVRIILTSPCYTQAWRTILPKNHLQIWHSRLS